MASFPLNVNIPDSEAAAKFFFKEMYSEPDFEPAAQTLSCVPERFHKSARVSHVDRLNRDLFKWFKLDNPPCHI